MKIIELTKESLDNNKPIVIIGGTDSGKTNLAVYLANKCSHPKKYILGYPSQIAGFININDKDELYRLDNCVVVVDEFGRYFKRYGRHHNDSLEEALDFSEHRNVKIILTAQNNQEIDRTMESKIKCWALKRVNVHTLKQGGMCKVAIDTIKDPRITQSYLAFDNSEFLWWNIDSIIGENGVKSFPNQDIPKAWGVNNVQRNVQQKVQKVVQQKV